VPLSPANATRRVHAAGNRVALRSTSGAVVVLVGSRVFGTICWLHTPSKNSALISPLEVIDHRLVCRGLYVKRDVL
jgi:hypothetical protein